MMEAWEGVLQLSSVALPAPLVQSVFTGMKPDDDEPKTCRFLMEY
jgi:hypothetical protein